MRDQSGLLCGLHSVVLDAYALRLVGAAREAAYFATAPLIGAIGAAVLLKEPLRWFHRHRHAQLVHDHLHLPDPHHRHEL